MTHCSNNSSSLKELYLKNKGNQALEAKPLILLVNLNRENLPIRSNLSKNLISKIKKNKQRDILIRIVREVMTLERDT